MRFGSFSNRTRPNSIHIKWRLLLALLISIAAVPFGTVVALAKSQSTTMSSVVGFNGYFGPNHWVPVNLIIHHSGPAVPASIVVHIDTALGNNRFAQGQLQWVVRLPANGQLTKQISVPGNIINHSAVVQCFVRGRLEAVVHLSGTALGHNSLAIVLSAHSQDAQFLTGSTDGLAGGPVLPVALSPDLLPSSANVLDGIGSVATTPERILDLPKNQRQALLTWVKLGGLLIVMGVGDGHSAWEQSLPMLPGKVHKVSGTGLSNFLGQSVTPPQQVISTAGKLTDTAELWAGTIKNPLVAAVHQGRGIVVQTAFNPMQPNLLTWPYNAALWTKIFEHGSVHSESALPNLLSNKGALQLVSASDALTPLRVPSLKFWASIFMLYTIAVGPILFFVLRRLKSEPWGWIVLPTVSLIMTMGIYAFGISQRPSGILTEGVGVLDLLGDGNAEAYGIRAFMSPYVTTTVSVASPGMQVLTMAENNVRQAGTALVVNHEHPTVTFDNVGRWGVRYLYASGVVSNQGKIDIHLWSTLGLLTGTVTNTTPYPLHEAAICWNGQMYPLGNLAPNQTISINQTASSQTASGGYLSAYGSYNHDITRGFGRSIGSFAAQAALLSVKMDASQAMVVATTTDATPGLPTLGTSQRFASSHTLALVRQFGQVDVYPASGVTKS